MGNLFAQPRGTGLGVRRAFWSLISYFGRSQAFFIVELRVATGDPYRGNAIAFRSLGGPTPARSHPLWARPTYLIRDNDSKFGPCFARVARTSGIKILKTPYHAPRANAICERFAQERQTSMPGPSVDSA
ncbi:MAG TPA: hypothetical protein VIY29_25715 [Ktedonobacteraceae bacterium]